VSAWRAGGQTPNRCHAETKRPTIRAKTALVSVKAAACLRQRYAYETASAEFDCPDRIANLIDCRPDIFVVGSEHRLYDEFVICRSSNVQIGCSTLRIVDFFRNGGIHNRSDFGGAVPME
jgi:hypothetical protein